MKYLFLIFVSFLTVNALSAQSLSISQKKQEQRIKKAHAANKISELEYSKLMEEQKVIKDAMQVANADGVFSPKEKNAINSKLNRAEKRLIKYQGNKEVY